MKCIRGPRWPALALALTATAPAAADTLTGRTLERGEPLAGVEILVTDASRVVLGRDTSRRDGTFSLVVPGGPVDVGAFKSDYATVWVKGVRPGQGGAPLAIELTPSAFVDGAPLPSGGCD